MSRRDRFRQSRTPAREAAERIETIIEAAERAAETVIDDAEQRAQGYLDDARAEADRLAAEGLATLSQLTDRLLAQAEAMGSQTESMIEALEEAKIRLGGDPAEPLSAPTELPRQGRSHLTAVTEPVEPAPPAEQGTPAGARLLATQMAVSGNSREEIELRLRNGFEIEDTSSILDAILGPED